MEKENDNLQDVSDSQLLREELLDLEDVDALLEQVMKEAQEQQPVSQDFSFEDEELQRMDTIMENASQGVPLDDEILSMLENLDEEDRGSGFANSVRAEAEKAEAAAYAQEEQSGMESQEILLGEEDASESGKKKKKEKKKKEKKPKEKKEKSEKKSFWSRIMAFVFEAEEDAEEEKIENSEDISEEAKQVKPSKKLKKEKKKKGKTEPSKASADDNAAIAAELSAEDKKNADKKKKKVKAKKEMKAKTEKTEEKQEKAGIGARGIFATLLVCFSLLGMIVAFCYALPSYLSLQAARHAFYEQNYAEALHRFYGHELNPSDEILYKKSLVLNALALSYDQYEIYALQEKKAEEIHALFEGYKVCRKHKTHAAQYGISEEWDIYRMKFLSVLENEYGVSEEAAEQICEMKSLEYTIVVDNLADGLRYDAVTLDILLGDEQPVTKHDMSEEQLSGDAEEGLDDLLPEEKELLEKLKDEQAKQSKEEKGIEIPLYEGRVIGGEAVFY